MPDVGLIVLAAGSSQRMGDVGSKQLLEYRGETLLRQVTVAAIESGCEPVVVVLGFDSARISQEVSDLPIVRVNNPDWELGMGSSIRAGVTAILNHSPTVAGSIITVCDQPYLSTKLFQTISQAAINSNKSIVASEYGGTVGVPAFFSSTVFGELLSLEPSSGAKKIIQSHKDDVLIIPFDQGAVDIDTPESYAKLLDLSSR